MVSSKNQRVSVLLIPPLEISFTKWDWKDRYNIESHNVHLKETLHSTYMKEFMDVSKKLMYHLEIAST